MVNIRSRDSEKELDASVRETVYTRGRVSTFRDGAWHAPDEPSDGIPVVDPYTENPIGSALTATATDVDLAVQSAQRAFGDTSWQSWTLDDRIAAVLRLRELIVGRQDELAHLSSVSMGMPQYLAQHLGFALDILDMSVEMARKLTWKYLRRGTTGSALVVRRPVGVVAAVVPWNSPIRAEIKKIVPALLVGCTVVLKPAPEAPFGAAMLAELAIEAGFPPGVLNLVFGAAETGDALVRHPGVAKVAFTGSSATGVRIASAAAEDLKHVQLELGGKSAGIVLDDADLASAAPVLGAGSFALSGQACTANSRVLAPRSRLDEVVDTMIAQAREYTPGDPLGADTKVGPLVSQKQQARVLDYIALALAEGATLVAGGGVPEDESSGWFVEPTVLVGDNTMRVAQEEIFGPVVLVIPYDSDDEAIEIANASRFGLAGSVFSTDLDRALRVAGRVHSGSVAINSYSIPVAAPFGGVKLSGVGREGGTEGFDTYLDYISYPVPAELAARLSESVPEG